MAKVFISHSWEDNDISRKIAYELKRGGAEIWIDYARIKPGEGLPDRIGEALDWCDTLVLVWSKSAAESYYVKLEWQCALDMQKKIIPCIVDDAKRPPILRGFLYIDFRNFSKGYEQLLRALDLEAIKPPAPPAQPTKPARPRMKLPTQKILRFAAILVAIVILGLAVNYVAQKIAKDREAKRAYWQKRQSEMDARFQQAQQSDGGASKAAKDKLQIWQQFLTDYAEDIPYSQQDNDQRKYANERITYWTNYKPPEPKPVETPPQQKTVKGMTLVLIRGGTFDMGDTFGDGDFDEQPVHSVTVSDFYMGRTEVTNAQFAAFLNDYGRDEDDQGHTMIYEHPWGVKKSGNRWQPQPGYENHPVINVTWYGAAQYAKWAGCRLPTEAEWEYAAREGGEKVRFGNGKNIADPAEINFDGSKKYKEDYSVVGDYRRKTTAVASFAPNALGLYDMSGNVWEWCSDWYDEKYYQNSPRTNPRGPASGTARVLRGVPGTSIHGARALRIASGSFLTAGTTLWVFVLSRIHRIKIHNLALLLFCPWGIGIAIIRGAVLGNQRRQEWGAEDTAPSRQAYLSIYGNSKGYILSLKGQKAIFLTYLCYKHLIPNGTDAFMYHYVAIFRTSVP